MSSFRRAPAPARPGPENSEGLPEAKDVRAKGVKPATVGVLGMVSSGNKELDSLLGGGLALGTSLVLKADKYTNFCDVLVGYSIAEGVSMFHDVLLLTHDPSLAERLVASLPFNRNLGQLEGDAATKEDEEVEGEDVGVAPKTAGKIAWQYDKYIVQREREEGPALSSNPLYRALGGSHYCSSFDLSRRLQPSLLLSNPVQCFSMADDGPASSHLGLADVLERYAAAVQAFLAGARHRKLSGQSAGICRIFIPRIDCWIDAFSSAEVEASVASDLLAAFTLRLKHLIRGTRTILCMTQLPEAAPRLLVSRLCCLHDTVLTVDSFAGREASIPREFHEFMGFFRVDKLQHVGSLVPVCAAALAAQFGIKRDRRKLHIVPLHLPPEESRAFGASGTDAQLEKKSERLAGGVGSLAYSAGPSKPQTFAASTSGSGSGSGFGSGSELHVAETVHAGAKLSLAEKLAQSRAQREQNQQQQGSAVSISSFRPREPPLAPGAGCGATGGGSSLDF